MAPDVTATAREAYGLLSPGGATQQPLPDVPTPPPAVVVPEPEATEATASAPLGVDDFIPTVAPAAEAGVLGWTWVFCPVHGWELGRPEGTGLVCGQCVRDAQIRAEQAAAAPDPDATQAFALPRRGDRVPTPPHAAGGVR